MGRRFAFDLGTSSLGWAIFETDGDPLVPVRLLDMGVRLFDDGYAKPGLSKAAERRTPRAMRRRYDRTSQRRRYLLSLLEQNDLLPPEGMARDSLFQPRKGDGRDAGKNWLYELRSRAAEEEVSLHEFGRVLWHLNQRRGFKSNRKTDSDDKEKGKVATGGETLNALLADGNHKTIGQFLATRQKASDPNDRQTVRVRLNGKGAAEAYDFYPQRAMLEQEFDALWDEQSKHHPGLTNELCGEVRRAIFFQRPSQGNSSNS